MAGREAPRQCADHRRGTIGFLGALAPWRETLSARIKDHAPTTIMRIARGQDLRAWHNQRHWSVAIAVFCHASRILRQIGEES
jgi:hypothetical protein